MWAGTGLISNNAFFFLVQTLYAAFLAGALQSQLVCLVQYVTNSRQPSDNPHFNINRFRFTGFN